MCVSSVQEEKVCLTAVGHFDERAALYLLINNNKVGLLRYDMSATWQSKQEGIEPLFFFMCSTDYQMQEPHLAKQLGIHLVSWFSALSRTHIPLKHLLTVIYL